MFQQLEKAMRNGAPKYQGATQRELEFGCTPEQIEMYKTKGFVIIKNVLSKEEVEVYRRDLDRVAAASWSMAESIGRSPADNLRYEIVQKEGKDMIWKIDPFMGLSPILSSITGDRRVVDAIASLFDGYEPVLFKDKLIIKPPQTHGNDLHQDYNWWQGFPLSLMTASIPLDDTHLKNGCTEVFSGHHRGFLHDTSKDFGGLAEETLQNEEHHYVELNAGDMVLFHCHTPHRAGINNSMNNRRVFFLSYNDSRDGEHYQSHYRHMRWYRTNRMSEEQKNNQYFL